MADILQSTAALVSALAALLLALPSFMKAWQEGRQTRAVPDRTSPGVLPAHNRGRKWLLIGGALSLPALGMVLGRVWLSPNAINVTPSPTAVGPTVAPTPRQSGGWRDAFSSQALLTFVSGVSEEPTLCERLVPATEHDIVERVNCYYANDIVVPYLRMGSNAALDGQREFYSNNNGNAYVKAGTVTAGTWQSQGKVEGTYVTYISKFEGEARLYWDQGSKLTYGVIDSPRTETEELKRLVFAGTRTAN